MVFVGNQVLTAPSETSIQMKRIIVTPAGRRRYLEILVEHLARQKNDFDFWHLWANTNVPEDLEYFDTLASKYSWICVVHLPETVDTVSNMNIYKFFEIDSADPGALYLRLDDDIVFLSPNFVEDMFNYRSKNTENFLVYANIVNNSVISHIHQRFGNVKYPRKVGYECMDDIGWNDPVFADILHRQFIDDIRQSKTRKWACFPKWILDRYERVSINSICWRGADFAEFGGIVGEDEELWLAVVKPAELSRPNVIFGGAVCAHFAFYTQRAHLDTTNILEEYKSLAVM
jgi:hypothetical protein